MEETQQNKNPSSLWPIVHRVRDVAALVAYKIGRLYSLIVFCVLVFATVIGVLDTYPDVPIRPNQFAVFNAFIVGAFLWVVLRPRSVVALVAEAFATAMAVIMLAWLQSVAAVFIRTYAAMDEEALQMLKASDMLRRRFAEFMAEPQSITMAFYEMLPVLAAVYPFVALFYVLRCIGMLTLDRASR